MGFSAVGMARTMSKHTHTSQSSEVASRDVHIIDPKE